MYEIEFTSEAKDDLKALRKFEQQTILAGIEHQLRHDPTIETRNRKRLRPNNVAEWELRLRKYRIFYNVEKLSLFVTIEAIGFKVGNMLFIRGKRREL